MCSSCYRSSNPPAALLYQFTVPADAVADKSTVPESQRCAGTGLIITGIAVTTATTGVLVPDAQPACLLPHKKVVVYYNRSYKKYYQFPIPFP
jgi:hypothetical protein